MCEFRAGRCVRGPRTCSQLTDGRLQESTPPHIVEDSGLGRRHLERSGTIGHLDMIFLPPHIYELTLGGVGLVCSDGNRVVLNKKRKETEQCETIKCADVVASKISVALYLFAHTDSVKRFYILFGSAPGRPSHWHRSDPMDNTSSGCGWHHISRGAFEVPPCLGAAFCSRTFNSAMGTSCHC